MSVSAGVGYPGCHGPLQPPVGSSNCCAAPPPPDGGGGGREEVTKRTITAISPPCRRAACRSRAKPASGYVMRRVSICRRCSPRRRSRRSRWALPCWGAPTIGCRRPPAALPRRSPASCRRTAVDAPLAARFRLARHSGSRDRCGGFAHRDRDEQKLGLRYLDGGAQATEADHLSGGAGLLRGRPGAGGVVRAARRLPAFPRRPDQVLESGRVAGRGRRAAWHAQHEAPARRGVSRARPGLQAR